MIIDEIDALKGELDELIEKNAPYEEIYEKSRVIDEYIVKFYKEEVEN